MRRVLVTLAIWLFCLVPTPALGVFVIATSVGSTNGGDSVDSSAINTTGASLFVAVQVELDTSLNTFSDSQGLTWNALVAQAGTNNAARVLYAVGTGSASHTFSVGTGGGYPCIAVAAFSGMASVSVLDAQNGVAVDTADTIQPGTTTPTTDDQVLVLGVSAGGESLVSVSGGFTIPANGTTSFVNMEHYGCGIAYLIQTSAIPENPTATLTSTANTAIAILGTFKSAVASGGSHAGRRLRLGV